MSGGTGLRKMHMQTLKRIYDSCRKGLGLGDKKPVTDPELLALISEPGAVAKEEEMTELYLELHYVEPVAGWRRGNGKGAA